MSGRMPEQSGIHTIRSLEPADSHRWDEFVRQTPAATFFHLSGWRNVIEQAFRHETHYLYTEENGAISGILPLVHVRSRLFGNALISTPFCVYGGIVACTDSARRLLESAACELATAARVDYLEMRNLQTGNPQWPMKELYVTFRKEIDPDPEVNFYAIPRKQRAMVRKGIDAGLACIREDDIVRFYDIYSASVHGLGTPVFSRRYFSLLKAEFGDACEVLVVEQEKKAISAVMSFYFRDEVLPYYGGGLPQARSCKAYDYMYWDVMRRAAGVGVRIFDYGRSKVDTGSYRFKKHWGFVPEPLHYEYFLVGAGTIPNISPSNPRYRYFIETWKRLPLTITRLIGPMLAKNLG